MQQESGAALAVLGWSPMFTDMADLDVTGSDNVCGSLDAMGSGSRDVASSIEHEGLSPGKPTESAVGSQAGDASDMLLEGVLCSGLDRA